MRSASDVSFAKGFHKNLFPVPSWNHGSAAAPEADFMKRHSKIDIQGRSHGKTFGFLHIASPIPMLKTEFV